MPFNLAASLVFLLVLMHINLQPDGLPFSCSATALHWGNKMVTVTFTCKRITTHFRVDLSLSIKARPGAQPFI